MPGPVNFRGVRIGMPICEEIWNDLGVCETLAESGAEILLVPNGSPYYRGKVDVRHQVALKQVIETGLPLIFANQLGGQDELVFDGASFAFNARQIAGIPDEPVRRPRWRSRHGSAAKTAGAVAKARCRVFPSPTRPTIAPACSVSAIT